MPETNLDDSRRIRQTTIMFLCGSVFKRNTNPIGGKYTAYIYDETIIVI